MFGDKSIDLSERFPSLRPSSERAIHLAQDPVAAADFFDFAVTLLFEHLFGWDYKNKQSTECGGILGQLHAFYGRTYGVGLFSRSFFAMDAWGYEPNRYSREIKKGQRF